MADSTSSACAQQSGLLRRFMAKLVMVMSDLFRELSRERNNWISFCFIWKTKTILLFTFDVHHNFDKLKQRIAVNVSFGNSGTLNRLEEMQVKKTF